MGLRKTCTRAHKMLLSKSLKHSTSPSYPGPQPILVKFLSHQTKSKLYRERTKLKNVKISNIYPSYSSFVESRIFIHENLTSYRKKIVAEANRRRRDGTLLSIWTLDGKIYVKTSPDGTPRKIYCVRLHLGLNRAYYIHVVGRQGSSNSRFRKLIFICLSFLYFICLLF